MKSLGTNLYSLAIANGSSAISMSNSNVAKRAVAFVNDQFVKVVKSIPSTKPLTASYVVSVKSAAERR